MKIQSYLEIPIKLSRVIKKQKLNTTTLENSIRQNIDLILLTHYGESKFNPEYGSELWDLDFEKINSIDLWKDHVARSVKHSIQNNEKRLTNIEVDIAISEKEFTDRFKHSLKIKKIMDVKVTGNLILTNQPFLHHQKIFISPISLN